MRFWVGVILALILVNGAAGGLDQQLRASQISDEVYALSASLNTAGKDFLEMAAGMLNNGTISDHELSTVFKIDSSATGIEDLADKYAMVTSIYSVMVNDKDKATVRSYVRLLHKQAGPRIDRAITIINRQLPYLKTPALVSQGERIRDDIRQIQDKLRSWSP